MEFGVRSAWAGKTGTYSFPCSGHLKVFVGIRKRINPIWGRLPCFNCSLFGLDRRTVRIHCVHDTGSSTTLASENL